MTTAVDILNLALSHIGDDALAADLEAPSSPQEEQGARYYPIARDVALSAHAFGFATRTETLTTVDDPADGWTYCYAAPTGHLRTLALWEAGTLDHGDTDRAEQAPHTIEQGPTGDLVVRTNIADAVMRYARRVEDPTRFPPTFAEALSWLLASYLAGPIIKGEAGKAMAESCYRIYLLRISQAAGIDANSTAAPINHKAPWINAR